MFRLVTGILPVVLLASSHVAAAERISLNEVLRRAASRPSVAMAASDRDAARGTAIGASLPTYNPIFEAAAGPRFATGSVNLGASIGLGQTIELGDKREARTDAAEARLRASEQALGAARAFAQIEAWRAYERAIVARLKLDAARESEATAAEVVGATQQAQALGGETQLRLNLAVADRGRAKRERIDAENAYAAALAELATSIGAPPREEVEPDAVIPVLPAPRNEDEAVARAIAQRPELVSALAELVASRADERAADAAAIPDVTLSVTYTYEPDPDLQTQSVLFGASIPLPLRTRNQGQRAAARALAHRAQLEAERLRVEVERDTRLTVQRYARAVIAMQAFDKDVTERLHENLQLAADSFRAGKIDFYAFSLARRDLFANRLSYLDAVAEAVDAWAQLARAAALEVKP